MSAAEHSRRLGASSKAPETVSQGPAERARDAEGVARRAEAQLRTSPYKVLGRVTCNHHQGRLTLEGRVPTFYHKQLAQVAVLELAESCDEVREIVNHIEVSE
ncbi:MAG: BON domain-containing protein [Pirellulaceae bacterium]